MRCFISFAFICLSRRLFVVGPAGAVSLVLRVDEHLHLELNSQNRLCDFFFFRFYCFNLCLKKNYEQQKILVGKQFFFFVILKVTLLGTKEITSVLTQVR